MKRDINHQRDNFIGCTWDEANMYCKQREANLAEFPTHPIINSSEAFETARSFARDSFSVANWWVGATDRETDGTWLWEESRISLPINSTMWANGEPSGTNNAGVDQNCGMMRKQNDYKLNDAVCDQETWASTGLDRLPLCQVITGKFNSSLLEEVLILGNDRTPKNEVRPDHRTSPSLVRPDAGPDRTGRSGRTYRRTETGPITEPRPDPKTGPTSDGNSSDLPEIWCAKRGECELLAGESDKPFPRCCQRNLVDFF